MVRGFLSCRKLAALSVMVLTPVVLLADEPPNRSAVAAKKSEAATKKAEKTEKADAKKSESTSAAAKPDKPETVKATRGPLVASVSVKGVAQPTRMIEFSVRPKGWTGPLLVKKAVEHGTKVSAGETLVEFDAEKLDLALRDAREERELAGLAIKQAEIELAVMEKQLPLDLAAAERAASMAAEDEKRFTEIDRPLAQEAAAYSVKSATFRLQYANEELDQLRKMYRDKDLTEDTEKMILRRYENEVDRAGFALKESQAAADRTLRVQLPRQEQSVREAVEKSVLNLLKTREIQPLSVRQKQLALSKMKYDDKKAREKLAELEADRAALTVTAPTDGLAYYGRYQRGQWAISSGPQGSPLSGVGAVSPGEVFLTLVAPSPVVIRGEVEEKEVSGLKAGLAGKLTPTARPEQRLPVKLERIAAVPRDGKFELIAEPQQHEGWGGMLPGMTGTLRFVTANKEAAITVPASAVFDDEMNDTKVVYLPGKEGGKPQKKTVTVGLTSGDRVEITEGLSDGEEILATKPKSAG